MKDEEKLKEIEALLEKITTITSSNSISWDDVDRIHILATGALNKLRKI